eukprot:5604572-Pleurochrysis_carterae.AAC.1
MCDCRNLRVRRTRRWQQRALRLGRAMLRENMKAKRGELCATSRRAMAGEASLLQWRIGEAEPGRMDAAMRLPLSGRGCRQRACLPRAVWNLDSL